MKMRTYRFRIYPSKAQEKQMLQHLWLAKNLWNDLLEHSKELCGNYGKFPTRNSLQLMVKNSGLFSQTSQEIAHRVENGIWRYVKLKKSGKKAGFPRFKSIDRMRSLNYPQFGFSLGKMCILPSGKMHQTSACKPMLKLKVTPFGEIQIVRHREIKGRIKTLTMKREPSGKWFACFAVENSSIIKPSNGGSRIGIDLGLKNLATLSNGLIVKNPRHVKKHQEKIAFLQRASDRKKKGSKNRMKAKRDVAIEFEKLKNTRRDFLHRLSHNL